MARLDMVFAEQTGRAIEAVDLLVLAAAEATQEDAGNLAGLADVLRRPSVACASGRGGGFRRAPARWFQPTPIPPRFRTT